MKKNGIAALFVLITLLASFAAFCVAREMAFVLPDDDAPMVEVDLVGRKDEMAREDEYEILKAYEQADFDFMRGVVYEPTGD